MPGVRTVRVDGEPLTYKRLVELVGERSAKLAPVEFDVAKNMRATEAVRLYAWLRRRGVDPSLSPVRSVASDFRPSKGKGMGAGPTRERGD